MSTSVIFSGVGGIAAFLALTGTILRALYTQISATRVNTIAVDNLTAQVTGLMGKVTGLELRVAVLDDRVMRRR